MKGYDVIRSFGLWKHPNGRTHYRLISLHGDTGLSPYALQWGEMEETTGTFTPIDAHRHDAARMKHSAEVWAHEWCAEVYEARRLLDYETTLRLYARLQESDYALRELDDMTERERMEMLGIANAVMIDLRARAGFDPGLDFPALDRMLIEWNRDTTGSDTTGYPGATRMGGSRMDAPLLGGE